MSCRAVAGVIIPGITAWRAAPSAITARPTSSSRNSGGGYGWCRALRTARTGGYSRIPVLPIRCGSSILVHPRPERAAGSNLEVRLGSGGDTRSASHTGACRDPGAGCAARHPSTAGNTRAGRHPSAAGDPSTPGNPGPLARRHASGSRKLLVGDFSGGCGGGHRVASCDRELFESGNTGNSAQGPYR